MNEVIGFCASKQDPIAPPWLADYPWLNCERFDLGEWSILLWGHGDLLECWNGTSLIVGKGGNRCLLLYVEGGHLNILRDFLGQIPVYRGGDWVSTCEECVMIGLGKVTLNEAYLPLWLQIGAAVGPYTLWNEIEQLYEAYDKDVVSVHWLPAIPTEASWGEAIKGAVERSVSGETHLAMTSGYDSRLLAMYMKDTKTWTLPITRSMQDGEYVWAKRTAEILGMEHSPVIIRDFPRWMQKAIEWMGTTASAIMCGTFAMIGEMNREERRPTVHGVPGDTLAGNPVRKTLETVGLCPDEQALALIRDGGAGWTQDEIDHLLNYEWRAAGLGETFLRTPGSLTSKADLFRVCTRSAALTGKINCGELWGGTISPYADSQYAQWALNLPEEERIGRRGEIEWATTKWPHIFKRPSPLQDGDYTSENTLDEDLACDPWPLMGTRFNDLFNQGYIDDLVQRALDRDMWAIRRAWALQPIAWAIKEGYA